MGYEAKKIRVVQIVVQFHLFRIHMTCVSDIGHGIEDGGRSKQKNRSHPKTVWIKPWQGRGADPQ